jgi:quinol monooxygenase YgiN
MPEIRFTIHNKVEDVEAFRDLGRRMSAFVRANEPGTTIYNWYEGADGRFINEDAYADSDALLTHLGNAGAQGFLDEFVALSAIEGVQVLGTVDDAAKEALAAFGAVHYDLLEQR